jgi:hypothetical protein
MNFHQIWWYGFKNNIFGYNDLSRKGCNKGMLEEIKIRIMSQSSEAV